MREAHGFDIDATGRFMKFATRNEAQAHADKRNAEEVKVRNFAWAYWPVEKEEN